MGRVLSVLADPMLQQIMRNHPRLGTQIILRWVVRLSVISLPKARSSTRQVESLDIFDFELTAAEMAKIKQLSKPDGHTTNIDSRIYQGF